MKAWCKNKRPRDIHACVFYQSYVFKQNITKQKFCHSEPHNTHHFEKKNEKKTKKNKTKTKQNKTKQKKEKQSCESKHFLTGTANLWFPV